MAKRYKLIIIGSGPAGLTAAIYASRAELKPLCIEGGFVQGDPSHVPGGQLMITSDVENYPGFPESVTGPELMERFRKQAERFGTEFITDDATKVDFSRRPFGVWVHDDAYEADAVIISTGAKAKWLGIPAEHRFHGKGLSACAVCDAAFFKNVKVAVVGGGDTAVEEATLLTKFASEVTLIHRRDSLRASKIMQDRATKNPKIRFEWDSAVEDILPQAGKELVGAVVVKNLKTGVKKELAAEGLFIAIGHEPNTKLFQGQIDLDPGGYILVKAGSTATNVAGVFAAGDVADHTYRQAVTAAGTGCMAALDAERFLSH
jgi:thioredoxin reductase (NADPH)